MNKLGMQAQFVPIISFGISCSFTERDTLHQMVQPSTGAGTRRGALQSFLEGPPTQPYQTSLLHLLKNSHH